MTSAHDLLTSGANPLKLEYFDIEGVAEQVRIALSVANVPFEDVRIKFPDWATLKPTKKHLQLPEMILPDGTVVTDSMCMLRLAGEADKEGKLYPADITKRMKIEQVLGLVGDMSRAWSPGLYIGMRPQKFGYAPKEEWKEEEFNALVKKVRGAFLSEELPNYAKFFTEYLSEAGGDKFLTGEDMTVADIAAYQGFHYYRRGLADHVPQNCLDGYPEILGWMGRVESHPGVAAYLAKRG